MFAPPRRDDGLDLAALAAEATARGLGPGSGRPTLGLTLATLGVELSYDLRSAPARAGVGWCVTVAQATARVGYSDVRVLVAAEAAADPCLAGPSPSTKGAMSRSTAPCSASMRRTCAAR